MGHSPFQLTSSAFADGQWIPLDHTGAGRDLSPPLHWSGAPLQAQSYTLVFEDPDAPHGTWLHWLLFDIPAPIGRLPAGLPRSPYLANGARHGLCWGVHHFSRLGYHGPLPPPGSAHRYRFQLIALDTLLVLPAGSTIADVRSAMAGHDLGRAELWGIYSCERQSLSSSSTV